MSGEVKLYTSTYYQASCEECGWNCAHCHNNELGATTCKERHNRRKHSQCDTYLLGNRCELSKDHETGLHRIRYHDNHINGYLEFTFSGEVNYGT